MRKGEIIHPLYFFQMLLHPTSLTLILCWIAHMINAGIVLETSDQHVYFKKENRAYLLRGTWKVSFIHDTKYLETSYRHLIRNLNAMKNVLYAMKKQFSTSNEMEDYYNSVQRQIEVVNEISWNVRNAYSKSNIESAVMIKRTKRSLLPLGSVFKFLFGVSSEEDTTSLQKQMNDLAESEHYMLHSVENSLTMINTTRSDVIENRLAINSLIASTNVLDSTVTNLTHDIARILLPLRNFVLSYARIQQSIYEAEFQANRLLAQLATINDKVQHLLLEQLTSEIVPPVTLLNVLISINDLLQDNLSLPVNPHENLWYFYQNIKCNGFIHYAMIHSVCEFPLIQTQDIIDLYSTHSLGAWTAGGALTIQLSNNFATAHDGRNPIQLDYQLCSDREICILSDNIIKRVDNNSCEWLLFNNDEEAAKIKCVLKASSKITFPDVRQIGPRQFAVSVNDPISARVDCRNERGQTVLLQRPVTTMYIPKDCSVVTDYFSIPCIAMFNSTSVIDDNITETMTVNTSFLMGRVGELNLLHDELAKLKINDALPKIDELTFDLAINILRSKIKETNRNDSDPPVKILILAPMILVVLVAIILVVLRWRAKRGLPRMATDGSSIRPDPDDGTLTKNANSVLIALGVLPEKAPQAV